jgi:hypothetical protein
VSRARWRERAACRAPWRRAAPASDGQARAQASDRASRPKSTPTCRLACRLHVGGPGWRGPQRAVWARWGASGGSPRSDDGKPEPRLSGPSTWPGDATDVSARFTTGHRRAHGRPRWWRRARCCPSCESQKLIWTRVARCIRGCSGFLPPWRWCWRSGARTGVTSYLCVVGTCTPRPPYLAYNAGIRQFGNGVISA